MKRSLALLFAVFVLAAAALAGDKSNLPRQILHARYVYVTDLQGRSDISPAMQTDDRHAVNEVQDALRHWGRYIVVLRPEEADIVIAMRSGRLIAARGTSGIPVGGVQIGYPRGDVPNSPPPDRPGVGVGVDAGPSDDLLEVLDARQGVDGVPLYRRLRSGGLNPPGVPLFRDFRNEVEKAAKEDQEKNAKKKKTP